jgi:hypothetical protein
LPSPSVYVSLLGVLSNFGCLEPNRSNRAFGNSDRTQPLIAAEAVAQLSSKSQRRYCLPVQLLAKNSSGRQESSRFPGTSLVFVVQPGAKYCTERVPSKG